MLHDVPAWPRTPLQAPRPRSPLAAAGLSPASAPTRSARDERSAPRARVRPTAHLRGGLAAPPALDPEADGAELRLTRRAVLLLAAAREVHAADEALALLRRHRRAGLGRGAPRLARRRRRGRRCRRCRRCRRAAAKRDAKRAAKRAKRGAHHRATLAAITSAGACTSSINTPSPDRGEASSPRGWMKQTS